MVEKARTASGRQGIVELGWSDFERMTDELFRQRGFGAVETLGGPNGKSRIQTRQDQGLGILGLQPVSGLSWDRAAMRSFEIRE